MPNPLCHFELMTDAPEKCKEFYGSVFDWQFDDESMPGYSLIQAGAEPSGAIFPKPEGVPRGCLNVYFQVNDIEETLTKAMEHGGEVLVHKTAIPGVGHFGMFADPEGLAIGILQSDA